MILSKHSHQYDFVYCSTSQCGYEFWGLVLGFFFHLADFYGTNAMTLLRKSNRKKFGEKTTSENPE